MRLSHVEYTKFCDPRAKFFENQLSAGYNELNIDSSGIFPFTQNSHLNHVAHNLFYRNSKYSSEARSSLIMQYI